MLAAAIPSRHERFWDVQGQVLDFLPIRLAAELVPQKVMGAAAPTVTPQGDVESGDESLEDLVQAPPLTLRGCFTDDHLEKVFLEEYAKPRLERSLMVTAAVFAGMISVQTAVRLSVLGEEALSRAIIVVPFFNVAIAVATAVVALCSQALKLSFPSIAAPATVGMMMISVLLQLPERLDAYLEGNMDNIGQDTGVVFGLRFCLMMLYAGLFTSLPRLHFLAVAIAGLASATFVEVVLSTTDPVNIFTYFLVAIMAFAGHNKVAKTERGQFVFRKNVRTAITARELKERERAEQAVELARVSAAKNARSRLIRIVRSAAGATARVRQVLTRRSAIPRPPPSPRDEGTPRPSISTARR